MTFSFPWTRSHATAIEGSGFGNSLGENTSLQLTASYQCLGPLHQSRQRILHWICRYKQETRWRTKLITAKRLFYLFEQVICLGRESQNVVYILLQTNIPKCLGIWLTKPCEVICLRQKGERCLSGLGSFVCNNINLQTDTVKMICWDKAISQMKLLWYLFLSLRQQFNARVWEGWGFNRRFAIKKTAQNISLKP